MENTITFTTTDGIKVTVYPGYIITTEQKGHIRIRNQEGTVDLNYKVTYKEFSRVQNLLGMQVQQESPTSTEDAELVKNLQELQMEILLNKSDDVDVIPLSFKQRRTLSNLKDYLVGLTRPGIVDYSKFKLYNASDSFGDTFLYYTPEPSRDSYLIARITYEGEVRSYASTCRINIFKLGSVPDVIISLRKSVIDFNTQTN